ncbi:NUMOD4 domain-containing protein [Pseudomonas aeruginosa]|uniref:NUMOD4 domain-containing protein n=1 Tax=Pseudomonas aeruginosa TaxID=287 RepID=UPI0028FF7F71|nr:NUMOD4 domain-containing protein [Pseudomonas aeruginosa]MDU0602411.1 NUMOD4 domain-containing protein [Pseudomonas aeruginosa]
MEEIWKEIPGFNGQYWASNLGRIRSSAQIVRHCPKKQWRPRTIPERILKMTDTAYGYKSVELKDNGNRRRMLVHRLVAMAFIENADGLPHVNHIDANKLNNRPENLEWVTHKQNMAHAARMGLMVSNSGPGMESPAAKLTDDSVREIKRRLAAGEGPASIARNYPVTPSAISEIKAGRSWSHISLDGERKERAA